MPDRLFIPSSCHNFGCVYSEVSGGLSYSQTAKPWHFNKDVEEHHLLKEEAFLQNEKWRHLLHNMFSKQLTFAIAADENILANTHIDPGQVGQKIPLLTTRVKTLAADKHVIAKLPLVPF